MLPNSFCFLARFWARSEAPEGGMAARPSLSKPPAPGATTPSVSPASSWAHRDFGLKSSAGLNFFGLHETPFLFRMSSSR